MWLLIVGPAGALALIALMVLLTGGSGDTATDAIYRRLPQLLMRPAAIFFDRSFVTAVLVFGAAYGTGLAILWHIVSVRGHGLPLRETRSHNALSTPCGSPELLESRLPHAEAPLMHPGPAHPEETGSWPRGTFAGVPSILPLATPCDFMALARGNLARRSSFGA